jgi:hypothetical protein
VVVTMYVFCERMVTVQRTNPVNISETNSSTQVLDGSKLKLFSHFLSVVSQKKVLYFPVSQYGFRPLYEKLTVPSKMTGVTIFYTILFHYESNIGPL